VHSEQPVKAGFLQSPYDSHLLYTDTIAGAAQLGYSSLNYFGANAIPDDFSNGVLNSAILSPVNQRLNPVNLKRSYYVASSGDGLHYNVHDPFQELQCIQNRYLRYKRRLPFNDRARALASEMVDLFSSECMNITGDIYDEGNLYSIFSNFVKAAKAKHYPEQRIGFDNTNARLIRFMMKNILKPSKGELNDLYKAGQGISAWSKDAQILFGGVMRSINNWFLKCLKPNVIYNNGYNEEQLVVLVNGQLRSLNVLAVDGVTDMNEFDANQNQFTQYIERLVLERMGVRKSVIDLYYSFRENYKFASRFVYANGGMTKTSGEPATLLMNSILSAVITNYLLRGDGPFAMVVQGDDVTKRQLNLKLNEQNYDRFKQFVNLSIKISIGKGMEFCGYLIVGGKMVPSLVRKIKKVTGHRFRDYKHFCEYQQSIRNNLELIYRQGLTEVIAYNAQHAGVTFNEAESWFFQYQAFGHVDQIEFDRIFTRIVVNPIIPISGSYVEY
jgi:hypothetical protein